MPAVVWLFCVVLVVGAFYLWMNAAPTAGDDFGNVFFAGFLLIIAAAAIAKRYQTTSGRR